MSNFDVQESFAHIYPPALGLLMALGGGLIIPIIHSPYCINNPFYIYLIRRREPGVKHG